jgi:hypothetical protein
MAGKKKSGAQNRAAAKVRAKAAGVLAPLPPALAELASLTGVVREKGRNYRNWRLGKLSHDAYLVSVRGLSALAGALTAREAERQREIDEQLLRSLEQMEARQAGMPLVELTHSGPALVGELMPREESSDVEHVPRGTPDDDGEVCG